MKDNTNNIKKNRFLRKYTENIVKILFGRCGITKKSDDSKSLIQIKTSVWKILQAQGEAELNRPRHAAHYRFNYEGTLHQQLFNRIFEQHNENTVRLKTISSFWSPP